MMITSTEVIFKNKNMKAYTMSARALTESANQFKEIFTKQMLKEGVIDKDQINKMNQYCVVVHEKGFFGSLWDKIQFKKDSSDMVITVVKVVNELENE